MLEMENKNDNSKELSKLDKLIGVWKAFHKISLTDNLDNRQTDIIPDTNLVEETINFLEDHKENLELLISKKELISQNKNIEISVNSKENIDELTILIEDLIKFKEIEFEDVNVDSVLLDNTIEKLNNYVNDLYNLEEIKKLKNYHFNKIKKLEDDNKNLNKQLFLLRQKLVKETYVSLEEICDIAQNNYEFIDKVYNDSNVNRELKSLYTKNQELKKKFKKLKKILND